MKRYRYLLAAFLMIICCSLPPRLVMAESERLSDMDEDESPEANDLLYAVDDDLALGLRRHKITIQRILDMAAAAGIGASVSVDEMAAEDFGDFTCNGSTSCDIDDSFTCADLDTSDCGAVTSSGFVGDLTGNADTASALGSDPTDCSVSTQFAVGIAADGTATCEAISDADVPNDITIDLAATASALAADPADCAVSTQFAVGVTAAGAATCEAIADADVPNDITIDLASAATALAANGGNCSSGQAPLGVDASGAAESCFDVWTEAENTAAAYLSSVDISDNTNLAVSGSIITLTDDTLSLALGTLTDTKYCTYESGTGIQCTSEGGGGSLSLVTPGSDGDSSTTDSPSGLETISDALTLLRGCADDQVLVWDEGADDWNCENQAGAAGGDAWTDPVDSDILPTGNDNTYDLGSDAASFADAWINGVAYIAKISGLASMVFTGADVRPDETGEMQYDNVVTGLGGGGIVWEDSNSNDRLLVDITTSVQGAIGSGDDGYVVTYTYNSGSGYFTLEPAPGAGSFSSFQVEDGDTTEVTIDDAKEWKFVEGTGIDIDWTDTSTGSDADPYDLTITATYAGINSAANLESVANLGAFFSDYADDADAATMRATLGLTIDTNVQGYDADLDIWEAITPSANVQSFVSAANYAAMKGLIDVDDLITLSGVAAGATHLGTFTGSTIDDNQTIKAALQDLETFVEGLGGGHDAVTLDANADALLSLSTQELGLDTQTANYVFAGPTSGGAAVPAFRALVSGDIPDISATYATVASINSAANLESVANLGAFFSDYADDADASTMRTTLGLAIGTDVLGEISQDTTPQLGGDLDVNEKSISLDPAPASDETGNGLIATMTVDANTYGIGSCLHLDTDGNYIEADANDAATMPCSAMALESSTGSKKVLYQGFMRDDTWNWTVGAFVFMSGTAGTLTQTAPSSTGDYVQKVGIATHADRIYFDPDLTMVKVN